MNYEEELREKLDAVRAMASDEDLPNIVDVNSHEQKILKELDNELSFGQYDLDESDILRTLKILDILQSYDDVFRHKSALKVFYILCRIDVITTKNLYNYCKLEVSLFKAIISSMARSKLLMRNSSEELELTSEGKSLAERMGMDIFF